MSVSDRAIFGATPRSERQRQNARTPTWCHPSVRHVSSSPTGSAGKPETVPPVGPGNSWGQDSWGHAPVHLRRILGATPQSARVRIGATRRFVSGRDGERTQNSEPKTEDKWGHPSVQIASVQIAAKLVPPSGSRPSTRCQDSATPQTGRRKWRRRSGPLRPELLSFARSCRLRGLTHCR